MMRSTRTRQQLTKNLRFLHDVARTDLLDPTKTNTYLIQALVTLEQAYGGPFLITSVRSDHGDDSDLGPHGHSDGFAVDLWPSVGTQAMLEHIANCIVQNPLVYSAFFGGAAGYLLDVTTFPGPPFIAGKDNTQDHIHIQVANENGGPGPRA